jgi:hypothetical protein
MRRIIGVLAASLIGLALTASTAAATPPVGSQLPLVDCCPQR